MLNNANGMISEQGHPQTAAILGASLDVGNRGVLALGVSLASLLAQVSPGIVMSFHYGRSSGGVKRISGPRAGFDIAVRNCRMSPKSRLSEHILVILALAFLYRLGFRGPARRNPWLRAIIDADFVGDIRGGDSFSDIYGFGRFLVGSLPLLSVALLQRAYVMLPQTYGPFRFRASRALAKFMLRRASAVLTRDCNCQSLVAELSGRTASFCPDVAFTLDPLEPRRLHIAPEGLDLHGEGLVVGVNVSGLLYMGGYTGRNMFGLRTEYRQTMCEVLDAILTRTQAAVLLVPHVFGSEQEEEACSSLRTLYESRYPKRVFAVTQPLSERELKWIISKTDFFIGSRMHACIAALSQCVPTVGLAYSDKFLGVFESAGVGDSIIDLRTASSDDVVTRTLLALEQRLETPAQLQSRIPCVQSAIVQTFRRLMRERPSRPAADLACSH